MELLSYLVAALQELFLLFSRDMFSPSERGEAPEVKVHHNYTGMSVLLLVKSTDRPKDQWVSRIGRESRGNLSVREQRADEAEPELQQHETRAGRFFLSVTG